MIDFTREHRSNEWPATWIHGHRRSSGDIDFDHPRAGRHPLDQAIDRFILGDVLIHTWDLSRATAQNEQLDQPTVDSMLEGLAAMGDVLQQSGRYGPKVQVAADADHQTQLLALTGRRA